MSRISRRRALIVLLLTCCVLPAIGRTDDPPSRPESWAEKLDRPGLPNLHKVNDGLYRGAQPTAEGIKELEKLGVRTIICLRSKHSDKSLIGKANVAYVSIPLKAGSVDEKDVVRFLRIVANKNMRPVYVHCQHGSDRTGVMCAAYRVVVQGWTKQQAIDEMTRGGYGFHSIYRNLPKLIENLDVDKIKQMMNEE